jgi:hypothetical protein
MRLPPGPTFHQVSRRLLAVFEQARFVPVIDMNRLLKRGTPTEQDAINLA